MVTMRQPLRAHVIVRVLMSDGSIEETDIRNIKMDDSTSGLVIRKTAKDPDLVIPGRKPLPAPRDVIVLAVKGLLLPEDEDDPNSPVYTTVVHPPQGPAEPLPDRDGPEDPGLPVQR